MTVKTYYVSKSGNIKLSNNFKIKEFQCKDGTDEVLIDSDLVNLLQKIRDHFKKSVIITSGYRTPNYNVKIGGSSTSYHVKGMAADIRVSGVNPVTVGMYAESIGARGIGLYAFEGGFVHIDTRQMHYRWLQLVKSGSYQSISKILPTIKQNGSANTSNSVKLLQRQLGVSQSGTFGELTTKAVKEYQRANNLSVDGIVGKNTWARLFS